MAVGSAMQEFAIFLLGFMILAVSGSVGEMTDALAEPVTTGFQSIVMAAY
jgi:hypothetical protein